MLPVTNRTMTRVALITAALCAALIASGCGNSQSPLPDGFSRLRDVDPTILQEMRYTTHHNFVGRPITGYDAADCWLTNRTARLLKDVQATVSAKGYTLKVYDCYRPQRAVNDFYRWAQDPTDDVTRKEFYPRLAKDKLFPLGYIAKQSGHSRGSTMDLTLVPKGNGVSPTWNIGDPLVDCAAPASKRFPDTSIDMGTGFDCFDPKANTANPTITAAQKKRRAILLDAMTHAGFKNLPEEWWHYTLIDEPFPNTYFDVPITK